MQLMKLLHKSFEKQLPSIHQVRLKNLMDASETLIRVNKLSLTALGRNLSNQSKTRSHIKKIDRLLNNPHLQEESYSTDTGCYSCADTLRSDGECAYSCRRFTNELLY